MRPNRHPSVWTRLIGVIMLLMLAALWLFSTAFAQETPTPGALTPTSPFSFNIGASITPNVTGTPPQTSLTGVNGQAERGDVVIRSGPGTAYAPIGGLLNERWIDVIGYNGYDLNRPCSANFQADLDMWVMVSWRGRTGWIARCALTLYGEWNLARMLNNAPPAGAPLPTGYPVTPNG
jgi:hypothetical protein